MYPVAGLNNTYRALIPAQTIATGTERLGFTQTTTGTEINLSYISDKEIALIESKANLFYHVEVGPLSCEVMFQPPLHPITEWHSLFLHFYTRIPFGLEPNIVNSSFEVTTFINGSHYVIHTIQPSSQGV